MGRSGDCGVGLPSSLEWVTGSSQGTQSPTCVQLVPPSGKAAGSGPGGLAEGEMLV